MMRTVVLVFHQNGELYFSSACGLARAESHKATWEGRGYIVRTVEVDLSAPQPVAPAS